MWSAVASLFLHQASSFLPTFLLDLRDTSTIPLNFTRSINLALSERGINALRHSQYPGLVDGVLSETVPMYGRMIHARSPGGAITRAAQAYDVHGRCIRAVDRGALNKRLLDDLGKMPNVKVLFHHKLTGADFRSNKAWFERRNPERNPEPGSPVDEIEVSFDLLIGADGAHSATRYHMMKYARMDYSQEYIDCLWSEFTIAPSPSGDFRISPNHLHIWPAGDFMFIAIPSLDKSFTCTLFGPVSLFSALESDSESELPRLFEAHFPGVVPDLVSEDDLRSQFRNNPHLPLINIKCTPHHYGSSAVIVGDAANALVPFYGQGMNAGFESVRILFSKLNQPTDTSAALASYTAERVPDAQSIADLALGNYLEMRSSVTSPVYMLRKFVEEKLDKYLPGLGWATQYSRISFGNERYSIVEKKSQRQRKILVGVLTVVLSTTSLSAGTWLWRKAPDRAQRMKAITIFAISVSLWLWVRRWYRVKSSAIGGFRGK